ncbi:MAG: VIT domain-containing protein [Candidatus Zixiibacteriota bacterium]
MNRNLAPKLLALTAMLLLCSRAFGIIIVDRPNPNDRFISLQRQHVDVSIVDGVSQTTISQTFHNNQGRQLEGTYLFPIPEGASVSNFSMLIGGVEVEGEILDKREAAQRYHEIVRRMQDPGLLEYVGKDLFQARVYPIPPHGDVKIKVFYQQVLPYDNGVVTYRFTSEDPKFYAAPIADYRLNVVVESKSKLKAVYSPTHSVDINRPDEWNADVLLTQSNQTRTKDFLLYYSVSKEDVGLNLLTHYDRDENQGYFLGLIAPDLKQEEGAAAPKNVLFVLDVSGSMAGEKIEQAKQALRFCLNSLNENDRFGIVSYSDEITRLFPEMLEASRESVREAIAAVNQLKAEGGTNINMALLEAIGIGGDRSFADYIIFLTDGEPTVGETNPQHIAENIKIANKAGWKIFSFGVGYDVDAKLLDRLSSESNAVASYVRPGEDTEVKVSSFFAKIANPAMTDIKIVCDGNSLAQIYPRTLPDLFYGMQLVVAGKFESAGGATVRLEGFVEGKPKVYTYNVEFSPRPGADELVPRQWAVRRIGYLLDQVGQGSATTEIKDEIVRLSKNYGIVTPYTSFFVEDPALAHHQPGFPTIFNEEAVRLMAMPSSNSMLILDAESGNGGSKKSAIARSDVSKMMLGDVYEEFDGKAAHDSPSADAYLPTTELEAKVTSQVGSERLSRLASIGDRTFQMIGNTLVDSKYDGSQQIIKIKPFSDAYFMLLEMKPEIGKYLVTGDEIIVVVGDIAVKICEDGEETLSQEIRETIG